MDQYLAWLFRWRFVIVVGTIFLVASVASGIQFLSFTNDYRVYFSDENPNLTALNNLHDTYTKDDTILFIITPKDGDIFTKRIINDIRWLSDQAWRIAYTQRVDSITNFQYSRGENDELIVHDLIDELNDLGEDELERMRQIALSEPLLANRLISKSSKVAGILVTAQFPGVDELNEIPTAANDARILAHDLMERNANLEVRLTGGVMIGNAFPESSKKDIKTLLPLMFSIVLVVLLILLRSLSATLSALLVILFSIVCAMGAAGWLGIRLSPPSSSAPNIILTIAVADCVHILVSFLQNMTYGWLSRLDWSGQRVRAANESLRINLNPVFLTSLTTGLGFLSLNFSDSPPYQDLGNIVALGVGFAFLLSVVFLPSLLMLIPFRIPLHKSLGNRAINIIAAFVISKKTPLLIFMSLIACAVISNLPKNELSDDPIKYFSEKNKFRSDTDYATKNLSGMNVMEYSIHAKNRGGIAEPSYLRVLNDFAKWYRSQPETLHVYSIADIIMRLNKNMHDDQVNWFTIPRTRALAAQYLLLYEMSLPEGLDLNDRINVDKSASRFTASIGSLSSKGMLELEQRAINWIEEHGQGYRFSRATGANMMFAHINQTNIVSMVKGTATTLVIISLILIFALKSLSIGALSLVPNVIPAAMAFGLWGVINGQINIGLSVVAVMTLGIVVDDTVHFLSKYLFARRREKLDQVAAINYSFTHVGNALWTTSLALVLGFLVLTFSDFEINAQVGLMTAITIGLALATDFLLLPPLLLLFDRKELLS